MKPIVPTNVCPIPPNVGIQPSVVKFRDNDGLVQQKLRCPSNHAVFSYDQAENGCGPDNPASIPPFINFMKNFLNPSMKTCCNDHDRCMNSHSNSKVCADVMSRCMRRTGLHRDFSCRLLHHFVNASAYQWIDHRKHLYRCVPIPSKNTVSFHWL